MSQSALGDVCAEPVLLEMEKAVLKQATVQHLYSQMSGRLKPGCTEAALMAALHPTPAVCGQPQGLAKQMITAQEPFDRGLYAGPVGWMNGTSSEFVVAIRSALVQPVARTEATEAVTEAVTEETAEATTATGAVGKDRWGRLLLYAGVGLVPGASPHAEWHELNLKIKPFRALVSPPVPLAQEANVNALAARLMVEELTRLGLTYFCIAPGSRSSALAAAAGANTLARTVPCLDERALAFHALGYARAAGRPAVVITSSGTAVFNLHPAVVEASQSGVPLLLLTADRPPELRDNGSNQTVDQVKAFEGAVRWQVDLPAPSAEVPARYILTSIDHAVHASMASPPGPVHVNCMFRDPLAPTPTPWSAAPTLQGLDQWQLSAEPFTTHIPQAAGLYNADGGYASVVGRVATLAQDAQRGMIVAGGMSSHGDMLAVMILSHHLGWPLVADPLSGVRLRASMNAHSGYLVPFMDQVLLAPSAAAELRPDVVIQVRVDSAT